MLHKVELKPAASPTSGLWVTELLAVAASNQATWSVVLYRFAYIKHTQKEQAGCSDQEHARLRIAEAGRLLWSRASETNFRPGVLVCCFYCLLGSSGPLLWRDYRWTLATRPRTTIKALKWGGDSFSWCGNGDQERCGFLERIKIWRFL
jgi:hypothetical protein